MGGWDQIVDFLEFVGIGDLVPKKVKEEGDDDGDVGGGQKQYERNRQRDIIANMRDINRSSDCAQGRKYIHGDEQEEMLKRYDPAAYLPLYETF